MKYAAILLMTTLAGCVSGSVYSNGAPASNNKSAQTDAGTDPKPVPIDRPYFNSTDRPRQ